MTWLVYTFAGIGFSSVVFSAGLVIFCFVSDWRSRPIHCPECFHDGEVTEGGVARDSDEGCNGSPGGGLYSHRPAPSVTSSTEGDAA